MDVIKWIVLLAMVTGCATTQVSQKPAPPSLTIGPSDSPPMPPRLPMLLASNKVKSAPLPQVVFSPLVVPTVVCTNCAYIHSWTNYINDFTHRPTIEFQVAGMQDGHSYIVQKSSNLRSWTFIDGWVWFSYVQGLFVDGDWTIDYPSWIDRQAFFRVIDQGTNQPPTPVNNK